jgi:hypothetical protein
LQVTILLLYDFESCFIHQAPSSILQVRPVDALFRLVEPDLLPAFERFLQPSPDVYGLYCTPALQGTGVLFIPAAVNALVSFTKSGSNLPQSLGTWINPA